MSREAEDRRYIRAVEAAWSRILGRPAVVSPREFEAIDAWRRRGVPLSIVLEVIAAAGKRRSGKAPRALTALSEAVEIAWAAVAAGRTAGAVATPRPDRDAALRAWEEARLTLTEGDPLRALLAGLVAEARGGRDAAALDAALDEALAGVGPKELIERSRRDTERELAGFRSRMTEAEFGMMLARARIDRLRAALRLPRLALTR